MSYKRILCPFIAISLCIVLSGCLELPNLAPKEPVTIKFVYGEEDTAYYQSLIEEFNKDYPHITVELVSWRNVYRANFEDIDVFAASQFELDFFLAEGWVANLNALVERDEDLNWDDFYPGTATAVSGEGLYWGLPVGVDVIVMHYNKRLFDQYNVPYPQIGWTWQDFLERAAAISHPDNGIFGYAYHDTGDFGLLEPMMFIYQHGGRMFDDLNSPTHPTFNEPLTVEALAWYGALIHRHHVAPMVGERSTPYPLTGIEEGKFGIWMGWFSDDREAYWGIAPLPRDAQSTSMATISVLYLSSQTTHVDASWEWMKFLSAQIYPNLIPARRSIAESTAYADRMGSDIVIVANEAIANMIPFSLNLEGDFGNRWGMISSALNEALSKIRSGEDAQTVLNEAQRKAGF
ncbi:MAG: sugar ABC transporter substrate-binding protein [Anaerolineae bacterium]|nr:sugar ABC transporter substrate-binding protein [Anaerolineae bacterium]